MRSASSSRRRAQPRSPTCDPRPTSTAAEDTEQGGRNELAPNVLLSSGQIKARLDELRRNKTLRVEPGVAFTMIYVHLFNFFLVEHIFGSGNAYGLAKEEAVRAICDAFLHGIVGDRRAPRTPVRRASKRR